MKTEIKLKQAEVVPIIPQREPIEGKRWSYSFVYFLEDLRNIYRLYDENDIDSIPTLLKICEEKGVKSWSGKEWNLRNLLEQVNALKNFKLLETESGKVSKPGLFSVTTPDSPLTEPELALFKAIYFSYFRFVEFHKLMAKGCADITEDNMSRHSVPIIYYMQDARFTNRYILSLEPALSIAGIPDEHADMMRFWDVYVKWGTSLNLLRKYPIKPFGITTSPNVKGLGIAYFYQKMPDEFSVFDYMKEAMEGSYLYIPDIVYSVMTKLRYSVEDIIAKIAEESVARSETYRAQSTSAIFINEKENFLFPKIGNTYITHLIKL